jgi:hypothetical protein
MEMTSELIKGMVEHCANDLIPGRYIQQNKNLLTNDMSEINNKMFIILYYLESAVMKKSINENII